MIYIVKVNGYNNILVAYNITRNGHLISPTSTEEVIWYSKQVLPMGPVIKMSGCTHPGSNNNEGRQKQQ